MTTPSFESTTAVNFLASSYLDVFSNGNYPLDVWPANAAGTDLSLRLDWPAGTI